MNSPEYITVSEVKRVCKELNIRDWTELTAPKVLKEEARIILSAVNSEWMKIEADDFAEGLEVELEHGLRYKDANVTNNHPVLTGKIVIAHLKETLDYYKRLEVMEIEGDIMKAVLAKDISKVERYYKKLVKAKLALLQSESKECA